MAASKYTKSKSTKKSAERGAKTNVSSAAKNRKVGFWKSWMALPIIAIVAVTG